MGVVDDAFGEFDILFERIFGTIDHDGSETAVHAGFADVKIGTVVQMECNRQIGVFQGCLDELDEVDMLGIFAGTGGNLENQRSLFFFGSVHDPLDDFHIIDIESTYCVMAFVSLFEHFRCGD